MFGIHQAGPQNQKLVTTLEDVPESAVENILLNNALSTSVFIAWDPPAISNGVITKYEIIIQPSQTLTVVPGGEKGLLNQNQIKSFIILPGIRRSL